MPDLRKRRSQSCSSYASFPFFRSEKPEGERKHEGQRSDGDRKRAPVDEQQSHGKRCGGSDGSEFPTKTPRPVMVATRLPDQFTFTCRTIDTKMTADPAATRPRAAMATQTSLESPRAAHPSPSRRSRQSRAAASRARRQGRPTAVAGARRPRRTRWLCRSTHAVQRRRRPRAEAGAPRRTCDGTAQRRSTRRVVLPQTQGPLGAWLSLQSCLDCPAVQRLSGRSSVQVH